MAVILDGKAVAAKVKAEVRERVGSLKAEGKRIPCLAVILVGEDPASAVYVRNKKKDCEEVGFVSRGYTLPAETTQDELISLIDELNADDTVDGILCQLPVPKHIDSIAVLERIAPDKDVDCFHPVSAGKLFRGTPAMLPCTPAGVIRILDEYSIDIAGKNCVVVGRSNIVGKPAAMMLLDRNGTVTVCHSKTKCLTELTKSADILVSAVGRANFITGDMVKDGAVVVDVGMNRNAEGKLCGDCDYSSCYEKASYITPVPGGVGPMTRAMLMENTMTAYGIHENEER